MLVFGAPCAGQPGADAGGGHLTPAQVRILEAGRPGPPAAAFGFDRPPGPQFTQRRREAQLEAGKGVVAMVRKAFDAGADSARIPPGDYRFGQETWGPDGPIYPLEFSGLRRDAEHTFTINATGATFWFDLADDQAPTAHFCVGFRNCSNVVFRGATIDRGTRGCIEGRITRIDGSNNRFEIRLTPGCRVPATFSGELEQRILPFKGDGTFCAPLYALQPGGVHLKYRSITPGEGRGTYWVTMLDTALLDTLRDPNWARAYGAQGMLRVGDGLSCVYSVAAALGLVECRNMTVQDVKVHAAKANGFETGGYGAHLWKNCYFGPRPGTNQWQGGEGFMFNATEHGTTLDGVTIRHTADDCANVHGYWGHVRAAAGSRVRFEVNEATGRPLAYDAAVGDRLLFWDKNSAGLLGRAAVVGIEGDTVVLDRPAEGFANAVAEWVDHECAGWTIRNCDWSDCYQRVLIQSGPGIVRGCRFTRLGSSLELNSDFPYVEGGIARDITVAGNVFSDVAPAPHCAPVSVHFHTFRGQEGRPMSGIVITGNTLLRPASAAIGLSNVTGGLISGNHLIGPFAYTAIARPGEARVRQAVYLSQCAGIRVEGNRLTDPGHYAASDTVTGSPLLGLGAECGGILLDGRAVGPAGR
jgi:hypothetical protein